MSHKLLNIEETAELLGVSRQLLATWRHRKEGPPFVKLSPRIVRYHLVDLETFVGRPLEIEDARPVELAEAG